MKRITVIAAIAAALLSIAQGLQARDNHEGSQGNCCSAQDWKEKMYSHKVAYISERLELSSAEAKKFWPVYEEMTSLKDEAFHKSAEAFRKLDEAIAQNRDGKEIETLFEESLAAQEECSEVGEMALKAYLKVLPKEKVARLFVLEENFRRSMIARLNNGDHPEGGREGMGPGGRPEGKPEEGWRQGGKPDGRPDGRPEGKPEARQQGWGR